MIAQAIAFVLRDFPAVVLVLALILGPLLIARPGESRRQYPLLDTLTPDWPYGDLGCHIPPVFSGHSCS
jgi:hypothetical protein